MVGLHDLRRAYSCEFVCYRLLPCILVFASRLDVLSVSIYNYDPGVSSQFIYVSNAMADSSLYASPLPYDSPARLENRRRHYLRTRSRVHRDAGGDCSSTRGHGLST